MTTFEALLMGLLQGLTEFIPVSSSGHLALMHLFFGKESPLFLDVFVHMATLSATLLVFRQQCWRLLQALTRLPKYISRCVHSKSLRLPQDDVDLRFLCLVLISFVITGALALLIKDHIAFFAHQPLILAVLFFINGFILFSSRWAPPGTKTISALSNKDAIYVGLAQTFAVLPGISRSGSCIAMLMHLKAERKLVGDYAFLLSIPTIFAAFLLTLNSDLSTIEWIPACIAFLTAFFSGFLALKLLLRWIQQGKLWIFSFYSFFVAALLGLLHVLK